MFKCSCSMSNYAIAFYALVIFCTICFGVKSTQKFLHTIYCAIQTCSSMQKQFHVSERCLHCGEILHTHFIIFTQLRFPSLWLWGLNPCFNVESNCCPSTRPGTVFNIFTLSLIHSFLVLVCRSTCFHKPVCISYSMRLLCGFQKKNKIKKYIFCHILQ